MTHICEVVSDKSVIDRLTRTVVDTWRAECNCGWKGPRRSRIVDAQDDVKFHTLKAGLQAPATS